jgi:precorrin-6B methylase 2
MRRLSKKNYWEENIAGYAGFYDRTSEENIQAPLGVKQLYRLLLFPIEKRVTLARYQMVYQFLKERVRPGMVVADIGCGSGIFLPLIVAQGARAYAIDFTKKALELVQETCPQDIMSSVELVNADITQTPLPTVDVAIAIGTLMYIEESSRFFAHCLPFTNTLLFNFIDFDHILNRLRMKIPLLDVRQLTYHRLKKLEEEVKVFNFRVTSVERLATGYMVKVDRNITSGG